jgi:predicted amidophosphoribosyltransferase
VAGYSSVWDCRICKDRQETMDTPKMQVCEDCLRPVADYLCRAELGKPPNTPGVDEQYWLIRANAVIFPLMRRWKNPEPTVKFLPPGQLA